MLEHVRVDALERFGDRLAHSSSQLDVELAELLDPFFLGRRRTLVRQPRSRPSWSLPPDGASETGDVDDDESDGEAGDTDGAGAATGGPDSGYHSACGCGAGHCFFEVDAQYPWGYGVENRALVPYRSLAVDTGVLTIGNAYYIAELDGVHVPGDAPWDDFVHDGCVVADDIGGAINGAHIDFFAALQSSYLALDPILGGTITLHEVGDRCRAP